MSWSIERQAIVIEFGHAFTKLGYAGEYRPRHVIRTPELRFNAPEMPVLGHWQYVEGGDVPEEMASKINFLNFTVEKDGCTVAVQPQTSLFPSAISAGRTYDEWLALLYPLLSQVFHYYLKGPTKDRRVILLDNTMAPRPFRDAVAYILFKQ